MDELLKQVQDNMLAAAKSQIATLNRSLIDRYLGNGTDIPGTFADWKANVAAGRADATKPPAPPLGWTLGFAVDQTTGPGMPVPDVVQWAIPILGTEPVCAMPPIPVVHTETGVMVVGIRSPWEPTLFTLGAGDTAAVGAWGPAVSQDGVSGIYKKFAGFMNSAYYIKIG
jgi:hypothetical protein